MRTVLALKMWLIFSEMKFVKKWSADDAISFKQWEKVNCSELMDEELPVDESLESPCQKT